MTHRPYPNADRARHQVERHDDETPPLSPLRALSPLERKVAEAMAPLRNAFLMPADMQEAMRRTVPALVSLQPLADALRRRPAGSEENTK